MAPKSAAAARLPEPGIRLAKVFTEVAPQLSAELRIQSIPTLASVAEGRQVARRAGVMRAADIVVRARQAADTA